MKPSDVLKAARKMIARPGGWSQGMIQLEDRCCALIAIYRVSASGWQTTRGAYGHFATAIGSKDIEGWNDTPGRTQQEVIAKFDQAINLAKQEE